MYRGTISPDGNGNQRIDIHEYNLADMIEDCSPMLCGDCCEEIRCKNHPLGYSFIAFLLCLAVGIVPLVDASILASEEGGDIPSWVFSLIAFVCAMVCALFFCKALKNRHDKQQTAQEVNPTEMTADMAQDHHVNINDSSRLYSNEKHDVNGRRVVTKVHDPNGNITTREEIVNPDGSRIVKITTNTTSTEA
eukprot:CCRYP_006034-RA/>CCRYP_006034-RA protein AED:0.23 eAED:0.23 QI:0/-1/0/1/-1/1/1/0/191